MSDTHTSDELAMAEAEREYDADDNARGCYDVAIAALREQKLWRDQVAAAVRSVKPIMHGGTCWVRATLGGMALGHLGISSRRVIGGAIFRAGPDPTLDTVQFCGPSNHAEIVNGAPLFHVWLGVGGDIVDFATGDWAEDANLIESASAAVGHSQGGMPPITFQVKPPEYIWQSAASLAAPEGRTPTLGKIFYMPGWRIPKGMANPQTFLQRQFDAAAEAVVPICNALWPAVKEALPPLLPRQPTKAEARRLRQMAKRNVA